jgi:hypothetical protein
MMSGSLEKRLPVSPRTTRSRAMKGPAYERTNLEMYSLPPWKCMNVFRPFPGIERDKKGSQ